MRVLSLLLDEHVSPNVAKGLRRRNGGVVIQSMTEWDHGGFLGQDDAVILRAASQQGLTLVTYDRRTIPPLLKVWAEERQSHGGVIFVDEKTISPADVGGLVKALGELAVAGRAWDWKGPGQFPSAVKLTAYCTMVAMDLLDMVKELRGTRGSVTWKA